MRKAPRIRKEPPARGAPQANKASQVSRRTSNMQSTSSKLRTSDYKKKYEMKGSDAIFVGMLHVSIHHVVPVFSPADQ